MKKLVAVAAALVLGVAWPELAMARAPAAAAQDPAAQMQAYLQQLAAWTHPMNQSLQEQTEAFLQVIDASDIALDYSARRAKREGRKWGDAWAAEQQRLWTDIGTRLEAAVAVPPPPAPPGAKADPSFARMVEGMSEFPTILKRDYERNRSLTQRLVSQIQAAAGGDRGAAEKLPSEMLSVSITITEVENELAAASMLLTTEDHPQWHVMAASKSSNLALIALLQAQRAVLLSEPVDEAVLTAAVRQHAAATEVAANAVEAQAQRLLTEVHQNKELAGTPLLASVERMLGTYTASAEVERSLAGVLRDIATSVEAPGDVDWESILTSLETLEGLAEKRVAIDQQRRQALQGA